MTFEALGLSPEILKAVAEAGYTEPTPIQEKGIPVALQGRDILGIAQTGTGKTASFTLPMIHMLSKGRAKARMPRSLIVAPTRELAAQVSENFENYGKYNKLSMALLIGGVSYADQERRLDRGVDVLIATPGRLLDHLERGKVMLNGVQILVIDEADRMLDMGFIPDIERICKLLPFTRQTMFYSATMPPEIQRLVDTFLHNPERIEVSPPASTVKTTTQAKCTVGREDKRKALRHLLRTKDVKNAIIFCNRKRDVGVLHRSLVKHGFSAGAIHGDLDQHVRTKVLDGFRNGDIELLVASDVAARGLDIPDVSHVFNFDVPIHSEDYVHRIGRTGRAGRSGAAFTIATPADRRYLDAIEKLIGQPIAEIEIDGLAADESESVDEGSGRRRGRGGRGRRKEPREQAAAKPAKAEKTSKDDESGKARKADKTGRPDKAATEPRRGRKSRSDRSRGGERRGRSDKHAVVGMGDHTPAFLLRPVKLAKPAANGRKSDSEKMELTT